MATLITEILIAEANSVIDNSTKTALGYYERANDIIKRTHIAMGRATKIQTTIIASTLNANVITTNRNSHTR
jgi:hypothetical protein